MAAIRKNRFMYLTTKMTISCIWLPRWQSETNWQGSHSFWCFLCKGKKAVPHKEDNDARMMLLIDEPTSTEFFLVFVFVFLQKGIKGSLFVLRDRAATRTTIWSREKKWSLQRYHEKKESVNWTPWFDIKVHSWSEPSDVKEFINDSEGKEESILIHI